MLLNVELNPTQPNKLFPTPPPPTTKPTMITRQRSKCTIFGACLTSLLLVSGQAFVQPLSTLLKRHSANTHQHARHAIFKSNQRKRIVLNESSKSSIENNGMIVASDKNLLNMAFSSLDDKDKYETVLTGLCAKVIDGDSSSAKEGLVDPIRLIEEMNSSRIVAGPRSIISLVDVCSSSHVISST